MKKRSWPYWLLLLAVLASASLIFFFSSQSGDASNQSSDVIIHAVISIFYPDYDTLARGEQRAIYDHLHYVVRKAAHFSEFALFGFALRAFLSFHRLKYRALLAWAAGTLYAATDELHQFYIGSRTAAVKDILIDSAGVFFGCLLAWLLLSVIRKKYRKKSAQ